MLKNKLLTSEILLPISDYNKIEGKKENTIKAIILIVIALIIECMVFYYSKLLCIEKFYDFILEYINLEIDIITILLSFTIACLTILITSNNENIYKLKAYNTAIEIDNKKVSLYQILLINHTYIIYNEIILLILLLIHKLIFVLLCDLINVVFFTIDIIILLNIIYIILKNVKNIYLSFWKKELIDIKK